jgi:multiple sugar transport system permease protein
VVSGVRAAIGRRRVATHQLAAGFHYLLLSAGAIAFLFPIVWALSTSLKVPDQVFAFPPRIIPRPPAWGNYGQAWSGQVPFNLFFRNTLIITIVPTLGTVLSCSLVAYGFTFFRFPLREPLFLVLLATMMIPFQVTVIPTYIIFRYLGWLDTYKPFIVPALLADSAFSVFLLRQFFLTFPGELREAATIDGAGPMTFFWRVLMPLSKPAVATVAVISFINRWNDFIGPLIYLNSMEKFPVSLGLSFFKTFYGGGAGGGGVAQMQLLMAAAVLVLTPTVVVFLFAQRAYIRGVISSGLRG